MSNNKLNMRPHNIQMMMREAINMIDKHKAAMYLLWFNPKESMTLNKYLFTFL